MSSPTVWKGPLLDRLRALAGDSAHLTCAQMAEIISRETNSPVSKNAIIGACHRNKIIIAGSDKNTGGRPKDPKRGKSRTKQIRFWKPKPEADMEIQLAFSDVVPRDVSLMDLGPLDCRYPTGDQPFMFCGNPVQAESSYCPGHRGLCYVKPQPPKPQLYRDFNRRVA